MALRRWFTQLNHYYNEQSAEITLSGQEEQIYTTVMDREFPDWLNPAPVHHIVHPEKILKALCSRLQSCFQVSGSFL